MINVLLVDDEPALPDLGTPGEGAAFEITVPACSLRTSGATG
jgi:hypothetical protein